MGIVLGFDTSCYTTSAAAVDETGRVLGSERMLLPVEQGQRGLRQSEAVFAHVRQMPSVMERLSPLTAGQPVVAVAASSAPRQGEDSYMPVFTVGLGHGKALASALGAPCFLVSHQEGHIAAGQIGNPPMDGRFVALHLSGGTTDLLLREGDRLVCLGGSSDLQAGQLIDRVGVALGLSFPAGPGLERLALACEGMPASVLPVSMADGDLRCHLSGAETQCQRMIAGESLFREQIALEVFDFLARTVARLLRAGARAGDVSQALVVGGVASSMLLRKLVAARLEKAGNGPRVYWGKPEYSADNAAGVAMLGLERYRNMKESRDQKNTQDAGGAR